MKPDTPDMRREERAAGRALRLCTAALALVLAGAGCTEKVDESIFVTERAKPVQRHDIALSAAANAGTIAVGMQSGVIVTSGDQGKSWKRHAVPGASIIDMTVCADGTLVALDFYHRLWSAPAAGHPWTSIKFEKPETALVVRCDARGRWWIAGTRAQIAMSSDQGHSWQVTDLGKDAQITTLSWVDDASAFALGEFGIVLATRDSGKTWKEAGKLDEAFYPFDTLFVSATEGYVTGVAGQFYHTGDGGRSWQRQENISGLPIYRLIRMNDGLYGVGAAGAIVALDAGRWRPVSYPEAVPAFLAAATPVPGSGMKLVIGGPAGLVRAVALQDK